MKKDRSDAGESKDPVWLTTFADSMSLLLTFFVLLFSSVTLEEVKIRAMLGSLKGSLGIMEKAKDSVVSPPSVLVSPRESMVTELGEFISSQGLDSYVEVETLLEGIRINMRSPVFFDLGRAELKREIMPLLDKIAALLKNVPNEMDIEGHTDNLPIQTSRFPSNWELSTARAISVAKYLIELGILPFRIGVAGYADSRPLYPNDTPQHRALNRRVEVLILNEERRSGS